jgi:hypothetical protein
MKRWLGIGPQVEKKDFEDLASAAIEALGRAQEAHISDLRVLIDKSHEREERLTGMLEIVVENRFHMPSPSGKPAENRVRPVIPPEQMTDVATFDEKADAEVIRLQEQREKELNDELAALIGEQKEQGLNKVE